MTGWHVMQAVDSAGDTSFETMQLLQLAIMRNCGTAAAGLLAASAAAQAVTEAAKLPQRPSSRLAHTASHSNPAGRGES